tara:strand:- start:182 stop:802 length:621 start_codon:yes stop_codon:yes gene_type:complete
MKKLSELLEYKKCAVISNSPLLLEKNYGELIDSYDVVFRCNRTQINGYEKHIGRKTDIRVINIHLSKMIIDPIECSKDSHYLQTFSKWDDKQVRNCIDDEVIILKDGNMISESSVKDKLNNNEVYDIRKFIPYVQFTNGKSFSAGGYAIFLASKLFESVDCFCFDFFKTNADHYFEKVNNWKGYECHDFSAEEQYLRSLENVNFIN